MTLMIIPLLLGSAFGLQPPGAFHGNEVNVGDGSAWLALRVTGEYAELVETTLSLRPFEDMFLDAPGERTGIEVSSAEHDGALAFLRGDSLQAGAVDRGTVTVAPDVHSAPQPYLIVFNGISHQIERRCAPAPARVVDGQDHYACSVVLRSPGLRLHVLAPVTGYYEQGSSVMSYGDDGMQHLLFAGDLDRDGKLDLIFDTSEHYNVSRPTLFLSSQAVGGEALKNVAHHTATGC